MIDVIVTEYGLFIDYETPCYIHELFSLENSDDKIKLLELYKYKKYKELCNFIIEKLGLSMFTIKEF